METQTMCNVGLLITQSHWTNESLHLDRFSRETLSNKGCLCNHPLPGLLFAFSGPHNLEHLVLGDTSYFGKRYCIFGCLILPLFLDGGG